MNASTPTSRAGGQHLRAAWSLMARAEQAARAAATTEGSPSLWSLAGNSILWARRELESLMRTDQDLALAQPQDADGDPLALLLAARLELERIPPAGQPPTMPLALVALADALREVHGRYRR